MTVVSKTRSKPKVKGSRGFATALQKKETPLFSKVHYFCNLLGLPSAEVTQNDTESYEEVEAKADQTMFEQVIEELTELLDTIIEELKKEQKLVGTTKWFKNDYGEVFDFIYEHIEATALSSVHALLDLGLYYTGRSSRSFLVCLVPWFITYAEIDLITQDVLLNKVANKHYKEYISRLPSEELFEFLVSDKEQARIMARNKIKMLESENCED